MKLATFARARSGDKGDVVDLSRFAPDAARYALIRREVTADRVRAHFENRVRGAVERREVPNLLALTFVLHGAPREAHRRWRSSTRAASAPCASASPCLVDEGSFVETGLLAHHPSQAPEWWAGPLP